MSSAVKKILIVLITIVAIVVVGGFILNTALPNGILGVTGAFEQSIKAATGFSIDLNGDGTVGLANTKTDSSAATGNGNVVEGFDGIKSN